MEACDAELREQSSEPSYDSADSPSGREHVGAYPHDGGPLENKYAFMQTFQGRYGTTHKPYFLGPMRNIALSRCNFANSRLQSKFWAGCWRRCG